MASTKRKRQDEEMFYEAMPATANRYGFGSHAQEDADAYEELPDQNQLTIDDTKTTAIITLILTALVTVGLALLFLRGLDVIKSTTPTQPTNASSQLR